MMSIFVTAPEIVYISKKAVHQQHMNFLVNTWVCVDSNMTVKIVRQGFYAINSYIAIKHNQLDPKQCKNVKN